MALIRPWMDCYAVCACRNDQLSKLSRIGVARVSGISNQRNFIEVNAETCHGAMRLAEITTTGFTGTS